LRRIGKRLIESGEKLDIVVIPGPLMDDFVKRGKITAGTSKQFVRVGMGVGARAGAANPGRFHTRGSRLLLICQIVVFAVGFLSAFGDNLEHRVKASPTTGSGV
jgi:hypothetical protein